ncbi:MAG: transcription termination factor NusA [Alphaproteobacteria bacterium]|nr:transcription termination factor NusA [Alphaproteobacteria bacterium]
MIQSMVNRVEFLQIADAVAREKSIDRDVILLAMEDAIEKIAKSRYGSENEIVAKIDSKTGNIRLTRVLEVVEDVEEPARQISVLQAQITHPDVTAGDSISEELPSFDFGRLAAQSAKQIIVHRVREAEREHRYHDYKDRIGDIVNGTVRRVEYGDVIVDLGSAEGLMRRADGLSRETFSYGDRMRAYIYDVRREPRGAQIFLSRSHPQFMVKLFKQEVPEIYDGIIEIKSVARDPGSRAKIAVESKDVSIDPVGACVGMRGSRVQAVVNELHGEKIDIVPWSSDPAGFIVNALAPAEVVKVVLDEGAKRIEVVVPNDQLSRAIGRRGQNVRLASQLTGWDIDIMTETEESERRQKEFTERSGLFVKALDVDEVIGQLLASEGFSSVDEVAYVLLQEIASIQGFDEDTAKEIQVRARDYLQKKESEINEKRSSLEIEDRLLEIDGLSNEMLVVLGENGVKTMEDLAGLVPDDLIGWTECKGDNTEHHAGFLSPFSLCRKKTEEIVMSARVRCGWIDARDMSASGSIPESVHEKDSA